MMHDVGHDGLNNLFHQNAATGRALAFNDQSIQENFHCMTIFTSMAADSRINILAALKPSVAREVRRVIVLSVLATDMKGHFKHLQELKGLIGSHPPGPDSEWRRGGDPALSDALCANLLHAADLSNPCRGFAVARRWADRVLEEFFAQGDREAQLGLPVSPLCARGTTLLPASQVPTPESARACARGEPERGTVSPG
jgi:calcium/calmodulin-dependent 3',5'-cyclic nucleotide phosphodiesterase